MLKKTISFSFVFLILLFGYQMLINYLKSDHIINYKINDYDITENFIKDSEEYYLLNIKTSDDKEFVFEEENLFNKQKQIVEDVLSYENNGVLCLSLKYRNIKKNSEPLCMKDGILYSYYEMNKIENLEPFVSQLNIDKIKEFKNDSEVRVENDVTLYNDYFYDNELLILYDYKQVGFYNKNDQIYIRFSNIDNYKNDFGALVGHYYMIPRITTSATFNSYVIYELDKGFKKNMDLIYNISKQSYINGIYNDKLYIFDPSEMKQYELDPYREEITVSGDEENNCFAIINGKVERVSVYDMSNQKITFSGNTDQYQSIAKDNIYVTNKYAVYSINGSYYKVYEKYPSSPIVLFKAPKAKEVKVKNDNVYYIIDDSIYRYNSYSNVKLATRNELKYNSENAFDIYFK